MIKKEKKLKIKPQHKKLEFDNSARFMKSSLSYLADNSLKEYGKLIGKSWI